ncbi:MAG: hypothetical protein ACI4SH_08790 [Candidatus Scatosoma sp.]
MEWGYLLILLSSILLCVMCAVRKEYQCKAKATLKSALAFMETGSLFLCIIGIVYCIATNGALFRKLDSVVLVLSIVFAFILTVNTCLCIFAAKYGSLAILTMFATLGSLVISTVYGLISDPIKNKLTVFNIIGVVLALGIVFVDFIAERRKDQKISGGKKSNSKIFAFICLAVFFLNGSALSVYSTFTTYRAAYGGFNFIFLYSFFCVLLCALPLTILFVLDKKKGRKFGIVNCVKGKPLACTLIYGVAFLLSEFFSIETTVLLPIVIQAPLSFAVSVIIVAIADYFIYKQKLTKLQLVQMALSIISGVCFAL